MRSTSGERGCFGDTLRRLVPLLFSLWIALVLSPELSASGLSRSAGSCSSGKSGSPLLRYLHLQSLERRRHSAFHPLGDPRDALAARIFLIDHAGSTIDLQYYIYEDDQTGDLIAYHLLKAAERGVKVHILLDDLITSGKDVELKMMASHPNIELRLFNPNPLRRSFRNLALLFNIDSLGKRMHNKALIADGVAAIVGGRNIGDVYYAADRETLFLDYDILATGEIVSNICDEFDLYWKSDEVKPSEAVLEGSYSDSEYRREKRAMLLRSAEFRESPIGQAVAQSNFARELKRGGIGMTVAKSAELYYDYPEKVTRDERETETHISSRIRTHLRRVERKLLIISPYFIPSETMMQQIKKVRSRGVEVTVITNSLASTDVFPVYSAYRWSIEDLLKAGVHLYELKPRSFSSITRSKKWLKSHRTSLHTKMIVIDDDRLIVGSANLDPRSDKLNTELVLVIDSPLLVKEKWHLVRQLLNEKNFYRLSFGLCPRGESDEDGLEKGPLWHTLEQGRERLFCSPPGAGFFKTLGTDLLSFLPIEGYL